MDGAIISNTVECVSNLETLNKTYGTNIIISEQVLNLINKNEFKIRFLDYIYLNDKTNDRTQATKIYEVFDMDPPEIIAKKEAIKTDFEAAMEYYRNRDFENAINNLQRCVKIYPDDSVLHIYLKRCTKFLKEGVDENWQPIMSLS